jgi:hypothetical protein
MRDRMRATLRIMRASSSSSAGVSKAQTITPQIFIQQAVDKARSALGRCSGWGGTRRAPAG